MRARGHLAKSSTYGYSDGATAGHFGEYAATSAGAGTARTDATDRTDRHRETGARATAGADTGTYASHHSSSAIAAQALVPRADDE